MPRRPFWYRVAFGAFLVLLAVRPMPVAAEVCNIKVVTDANPDYADIGSMLHSMTANWSTPEEKCWAVWYWNHIARRQTSPMNLHGRELTDPIRQFNDYGYTMCSTVSGVNCGIWGAMGLDVRFWDITLHTVAEVQYDDGWHMYDSSLSAIYTRCDGTTIASVQEIGAAGACAASGGRHEPGHIARYHCVNGTSRNGFLTGCDTLRSLAEEYNCFNPGGLKYRYYYNNWALGHRYSLNLRDGECYTRHYRRLDADSPNQQRHGDRGDYTADPAYYVANNGKDPESANPRYRIRGNGLRTWTPPLSADGLRRNAHATLAVHSSSSGVEPVEADRLGEIVFKVEGANVLTSLTVKATLLRKTDADLAAIAISTTNGLAWQEVFRSTATGEQPVELKLRDEVNGAYEVLVKVQLQGKAAAADAQLRHLAFDAVTMLNSKTQPSLRLGQNTVYVGAGEQTGSTVVWPEFQADRYRRCAVDSHNVKTAEKHPGYLGAMFAERPNDDAYVVFRLDVPRDMTRLVYGGRFYNRAPKAQINLEHSFDGGKTWQTSYTLTETRPPWDVIHYEKVDDVPSGTRAALVRYRWQASEAGANACSIFDVRMEANYKPADAGPRPLEVTFTWNERQADYSLLARSHTQSVEQLPARYTINVGGADHPVVDSLRISVGEGGATEGYSDGKDAGGERFRDRWITYGTNLAEAKPYTASVPSRTNWDAGDPKGVILTDGIVGPPYIGGTAYRYGALWQKGDDPVVTVDLGRVQSCGAFAIQVGGYPFWDALKGQVKDQVEVETSTDGERFAPQGSFDFNLRWKDIPANHMWPDEETLGGPNYLLIKDAPVEARYVRFKMKPERAMSISEVQVYDSIRYEPFDLRLALPDGEDRSDITRYLPRHTPSGPIEIKR
jgi:hypothetical protein